MEAHRFPHLRFGLLWVLLVICLWPTIGRAEENQSAADVRKAVLEPPLSNLERRIFAEVRDGRFGRFTVLEAGLIAGGIQSDEELQRYCRRFDALVESLRNSDKVHGTPREQAGAIFTFLHKTILRGGYSLQASDLRQAFDHGRFNCVTASLLLNCLAERFDFKAVALELPSHAKSRLELAGETLDIETTCPEWFRIDRLRPASSSSATETRNASEGADIPSRSRGGLQSSPRRINDVELVAAIYYNRGVDLLAEGRYADAAAANAKAVRLDPHNKAVKGNYLATINNWGIDLATAGQHEAAAELFRLGMAASSGIETFRGNYVRLLLQWSEELDRKGQGAEAIWLLNEANQELGGERRLHEAAIEILRRSDAR